MGMSDFSFNPKVSDPMADITDAALGAAALEPWGTNDLGKVVKLAPTGNGYQQASAGDEIEGVVVAVEPFTVNQGFGFGSVQKNKRFVAKVDATQVGTLTIGEKCVAGTQAAVGTANTGNYPVVKQGTPFSQLGSGTYAVTEETPKFHVWRVIRIISGTGIAGDLVLIERV